MDFLLDCGFTETDVEDIIDSNDSAVLYNVVLNKENVVEVINYLKEIGVTSDAIKDLFVHQIGMFYRTKEEIKRAFDEYEMESIVKSLNYDVNTVDLIEFN